MREVWGWYGWGWVLIDCWGGWWWTGGGLLLRKSYSGKGYKIRHKLRVHTLF